MELDDADLLPTVYTNKGGRRNYNEMQKDGVTLPSIESVKKYMANENRKRSQLTLQKIGKSTSELAGKNFGKVIKTMNSLEYGVKTQEVTKEEKSQGEG